MNARAAWLLWPWLLAWSLSAVAASVDEDAASALLARTNELRARLGLAALHTEPRLSAAAARFAAFMARHGRYGHDADGRQPPQRAAAEGYVHCLVAENIAFAGDSRGFTADALAEQLFNGWLNSPPHRRNMLDGELSDVGIAVAFGEDSQRHYAVQLFGRPRSQALRFTLTNATDATVHYRLGSRRYELGPGVARQHEQCRAVRVTISGIPTALAIAPNAAYRIEGEQGALHVRGQ